MKVILKHRLFNLFWHRTDGWIHYDYAERFDPDHVSEIWIPREWDDGQLIDAGAWIPDDDFIRFSVRLEDTVDAFQREIAPMIEDMTAAVNEYLKALIPAWKQIKSSIEEAAALMTESFSETRRVFPQSKKSVDFESRPRWERVLLRFDAWEREQFIRLEKAFRWRIVQVLDNLESFCWAELVLWAIFPEQHDFADLLTTRDAGQCARLGETPYCGKCALTGRHKRVNSDAPMGQWRFDEDNEAANNTIRLWSYNEKKKARQRDSV